MSGVALRPPRPDDRERVRAIVAASRVFRAGEITVAIEVFDGAVREPGRDYWAVGAYDGTRLVGYAAFGPVPCTVATWDLYWIAVDPAAQRGGIGQQLMGWCERRIQEQGGRLIVVETSSRPDYRAARDFYERLGYERRASIPAYYAPQDDLVVFAKYFSSSDHGTNHG